MDDGCKSIKEADSCVMENLSSKLLRETLPSCARWRLPVPGRQTSPGVAREQHRVYSLSHRQAQFSAIVCSHVKAIGLDIAAWETQFRKPEWYTLALSSSTFHGVLGFHPVFLLQPSRWLSDGDAWCSSLSSCCLTFFPYVGIHQFCTHASCIWL